MSKQERIRDFCVFLNRTGFDGFPIGRGPKDLEKRIRILTGSNQRFLFAVARAKSLEDAIKIRGPELAHLEVFFIRAWAGAGQPAISAEQTYAREFHRRRRETARQASLHLGL